MNQRNWAGNITYSAARLHCPESVEEVQELAAACQTLKPLGTRHSFNDVADTTEDLVSLAALNKIVLNRANRTVTVEPGVRYGELGRELDREGFALPNMASLPHISVAGACATATHGSGDRNRSLAAAVSALEIITASGEIKTLSREQDGDLFAGAVVGLGALGLVTKTTLDLLPAFAMRQDLYENLSLAQLEANFDAVTGSAYSVSMFTDWRNPNFTQVWRKSRVEAGDTDATPPSEWYGATLSPRPLHPIPDISAEHCTAQMGVPGPWHERLPHFRMDFTPSSGEELQTEYLLPRQNALAALRAVAEMRAQIAPLLQISEIRTVAADDLWLSPCYQQDSVAIHFTWQKDWPAVRALLPTLEACLAPFAPRPHWGKLFLLSREHLQSVYPRLPDFQDLMHTFDPQRKFRNRFLNTYIARASS